MTEIAFASWCGTVLGEPGCTCAVCLTTPKLRRDQAGDVYSALLAGRQWVTLRDEQPVAVTRLCSACEGTGRVMDGGKGLRDCKRCQPREEW